MSRSARVLVGAALAAYVLHLAAVFVSGRYLFADGSWFLLRLLAEQWPAAWCTDCSRQFFRSRFLCHLVQEGPTILVSRLTSSFAVLSATYGLTLLAFAPLSLLACWRYAADRRLLLFPLLSLFAGTMNAEVYSVHPVHLLMGLFWVALFILSSPRTLATLDQCALVLVSSVLLLCYETMLVFGPVLMVAAWLRGHGRFGEDRQLLFGRVLGLGYALGAGLGALAIAFPWDPNNRNDFFEASVALLLHPALHPGVLASSTVLAALVVLVGRPRVPKAAVVVLLGLAAAACLFLALSPLLWPSETTFNPQMRARSFHVVAGLLAATGFLLVRLGKVRLDERRFSLAFVMVSVLGLAQCAWHVQASLQWAHFAGLLRTELARRAGPIPFDVSVASQPSVEGWPIVNLHAKWPLTPLSLTLAEGGPVRSLVVFRDGTFSPVDPDRPDPRFERFGFDFRPYLTALAESRLYRAGERIDFTLEGQAWRYRWGAWHAPEAWGEWASGPGFGLDLDLRDPPDADATLSALVGAFVNAARPELTAEVRVNGTVVDSWTFRDASGDATPKLKRTRVPAGTLNPGRNRILFAVGPPRSPKTLGLGSDERPLSLAFVRMRLTSADSTNAR